MRYRSHFAGAVEAAASTGGQIMPSVMADPVTDVSGIALIVIAYMIQSIRVKKAQNSVTL